MKLIRKIISCIKSFIQKRKQRKLNKIKEQPMGLSYVDLRQETNVLDVDLVDDNASEKSKKKIRQYTKVWVNIILTVSLIDIQLCFVLAFLDKTQIAETLGVAILTEVVAIALGYMIKAFFETSSQKKNELEMERIKREYIITQPTTTSSEEETDGVG